MLYCCTADPRCTADVRDIEGERRDAVVAEIVAAADEVAARRKVRA